MAGAAVELDVIDIDLDPALAARYGWVVPVVVIDDRWRLVSRITTGMVRGVLRQRTG